MDTLASLLGGHEDDTAGTGGGTVDSGGGGILKDDDALDIIHGCDGSAGDAVHHPQHGVTLAGALATDEDTGRAVRGATVRRNDNTGNLALKHGFSGSHRAGRQFIRVVHDTHGSGQVLLLGLGAVTEGNGLLEDFGILNEDDVDVCASIHGDLLGHIAQARYLKDCVRRDIDGVGVSDRSTHCQVLRRRAERCRKAQQPCEQSEQFFEKHNGWLIISVC